MLSATSRTDWIVTTRSVSKKKAFYHLDSDIRLRPLLPISAELVVGCLLLHKTERSYGDIQTHRLCRTPLLVDALPSSPARAMSTGDSGPPNAFLLRTYFHIHSPTILAAMASTTLA